MSKCHADLNTLDKNVEVLLKRAGLGFNIKDNVPNATWFFYNSAIVPKQSDDLLAEKPRVSSRQSNNWVITFVFRHNTKPFLKNKGCQSGLESSPSSKVQSSPVVHLESITVHHSIVEPETSSDSRINYL